MFDANTTVNGEDTGCHTIVQLSISTIMQFNGVLSLFTTGSNTTALPDNTGVVGGVIGGLMCGLLLVAVNSLVVVILYRRRRYKWNRQSIRGWCMCMFCTCNCRSYYFVMWACWTMHKLVLLQLVI